MTQKEDKEQSMVNRVLEEKLMNSESEIDAVKMERDEKMQQNLDLLTLANQSAEKIQKL